MIQFGRRPYPYQTSHRIDEVILRLPDGSQVEALLKHLSWSELGANAQLVKPDFLHDPQREILAYRILADAGLGTPLCYDAGEHWLLLEKVVGLELWQVGQLETWVRVAGWLARFHAKFNAVAVPTDGLIHYDLGELNPKMKGAQLALNGSNLLNTAYVSTCANVTQCYYGAARTVTLTLRYNW